MAGTEQGDVSNEEFMEEVARYECVYPRKSKDFKDKNEREIIGKKFNLSAAEAEVKFRNIRTVYSRYIKRVKKYSIGNSKFSDQSVEGPKFLSLQE